jgi:CubicO group peptidase (beta-lactamase class C family)
MTKSFTALAILKLRDAGRLSLADPLEKYVPEIRATRRPTSDAPDITLQHLLTMSAGFPEDNPWGDRQLAVSDAQLGDFLRRGLSLANVPAQAFEYSNLGYALLGRIISQVAGIPYQEYIRREIMSPLGMKDTHWEYRDVPPNRLALGYRSAGDSWQPEPLLGDGSYGAMGGLLTTLPDFARYAAFHLGAWPARNEPDSGPVRRATLREMHQTGVHSGLNASAKSLAGEPLPSVSTYGNGLGWSIDSRGTIRVGHSGGLPGFGSNWRFYPDHGFAVMSFANLTYAGTGAVNSRVGAILVEKAGLPRRTLPVPPLLEKRKLQVAELLQKWNPALADSLVAENFFLDRSREEWIRHSSSTLARIGAVKSVGEVVPENLLRGTFHLVGETGKVEVFFTLTPEATPLLQELQIKVIEP